MAELNVGLPAPSFYESVTFVAACFGVIAFFICIALSGKFRSIQHFNQALAQRIRDLEGRSKRADAGLEEPPSPPPRPTPEEVAEPPATPEPRESLGARQEASFLHRARPVHEPASTPTRGFEAAVNGIPVRTRTSNLLIRSQVLYPIELPAHKQEMVAL